MDYRKLILTLASFGLAWDAAYSNAVGKIPGKVSVTALGRAGYSIPLTQLPLGNSFHAPVSLSYGDSLGHSAVGMNWTISGVSTILRCKAQKFQDGYNHKPNLTKRDKFCLDGQKLVAIEGGNGDDGTEYRTYRDTWTKVVSTGEQGQGPRAFIVKRKDGITEEYGSTDNAKIVDPISGTVVAWGLSRRIDTFGNTIDYSYHKPEDTERLGFLVPAKISFGGNIHSDVQPYRSYTFDYAASTPRKKYVAGVPVFDSQTLKKIDVRSFDKVQFSYHLKHAPSKSGYEQHLVGIDYCAANGECVPPTLFRYEGLAEEVGQRFVKKIAGLEGLQDENFSYGSAVVKTSDFDQDGFEDFFAMSAHERFQPPTIFYGGPSGFTRKETFAAAIAKGWDPKHHLVDIGDVDNDGYPDLSIVMDDSLRIVYGSPSGFEDIREYQLAKAGMDHSTRSTVKNRFFQDFNGDSLLDIAIFNPREAYIAYGTGDRASPFAEPVFISKEFSVNNVGREQSHPRRVLDLDDDGYFDLIVFSPKGLVVSYGSASGFEPISNLIPEFGRAIWDTQRSSRHFSDINGDGYPDAVGYKKDGVYVALGKGRSFEPLTKWLDDFKASDGFDDRDAYRVSFDLNNDGYSDFLGISKSLVRVVMGSGSSLMAGEPIVIEKDLGTLFFKGNSEHFDFTDIVQDGIQALFVADGTRVQGVQWEVPSLALEAVTDSYGLTTTIDRNTIQNPEVYQDCPKVLYQRKANLFSLKGPLKVVAKVTYPDGLGGTNETRYRYGCARHHRNGLGFLGFATVEEVKPASGTKSIREFSHNLDDMIIGLVTATKLYQQNSSGAYQLTEESYLGYTTQWNEGKSYYSNHNTSTHVAKYDTDGSQLVTIDSQKNYDDFGNLTSAYVTTTDSFDSYYENSFYTYVRPDTDKWLTGQLETVRSETGRGTLAAFRKNAAHRNASYSYDSNGSLKTETTTYNATDGFTKTTLARDVFGNPLGSKTTFLNSAGLPQSVLTGTTYSYDRYGFLIAKTNALGHKNELRWDTAIGEIVEETDPNGHSVSFGYNAWHEQVSKTYPDGKVETSRLGWCNQQHPCKEGGVYYAAVESNYERNSEQEFDGLDRPVRIRQQMLGGRSSLEDTYFDTLGRTRKVSTAYWEGEEPEFTENTFDSYSRIIKVKEPDGGETHFSYKGFEVTKQDPQGATTIIQKNALGEKLSVTNHDPITQQQAKIAYSYNQRGLLASVAAKGELPKRYFYNDQDKQIRIEDPEFGVQRTEYNSLGLPYKIISPDGKTVQVYYDQTARVVKRVTSQQGQQDRVELTEYDTAKNGKGLVHKKIAPNHTVAFDYDSMSRTVASHNTIRDQTYTAKVQYGEFSRPIKKTFSSGFQLSYHYFADGDLAKITNSKTAELYWQLLATNPAGQATKTLNANGVQSESRFDSRTGALLSSKSLTPDAAGQQTLFYQEYSYDLNNNLTFREDHLTGLREKFSYDGFNRLLVADSNLFGRETFRYSPDGNILERSGTKGEYKYRYGDSCGKGTPTFKHGVCSVDKTIGDTKQQRNFVYDKSGNVIATDKLKLSYNLIGKLDRVSTHDPTGIEQASVYFSYGIGGQRTERVDVEGASSVRTTFIGDDFEVVEKPDGTLYRYTVGESLVTVEGSTQRTYNLFRDNIGSIIKVVDSQFLTAKDEVFSPFGERRIGKDKWGGDVGKAVTLDGFTGHQHIDSMNLIHMRGRIYDPDIGRFYNADPYTQDSQNLQSLNRYSYVWNNPLSHTDSTGYFLDGLGRAIGGIFKGISDAFHRLSNWAHRNQRMIYATAITVGAGLLAASTGGLAAYAISAAGGYISGHVSSNGNSRAATIGAVTAIAFVGVGAGIKADAPYGVIQKAAAHGTVSGLSALASGRDFVSSFAAGAFNGYFNYSGLADTFSASMSTEAGSIAYNLAVSSIAGGLTSQAISGNFESGFESALTAQVFNALQSVGTAAVGEVAVQNPTTQTEQSFFSQVIDMGEEIFVAELTEIKTDFVTIFDSNASAGERLLAGAKFGLNFVGVAKGIKIAYKASKLINRGRKVVCFPEGTQVHTAEGMTGIEDIEVGDLVLSRDTDTGQTTYKEVVNLFRNDTKALVELSLVKPDGTLEDISTTYEHPFFTQKSGWVMAGELADLARIETIDGDAVLARKAVSYTPSVVYNFEVADHHTYFVGDDGYLVHNVCAKGPRNFPKSVRKQGFEKSKDQSGVPRCEYCKTELNSKSGKPNSYEADHRIPYVRGGKSTIENLTPSCRTCNRSKGSKNLEDWIRQ